jgi:hypothetical protein
VGGLREAREAVSTATEHSYFVADVRRVATWVRAARDGPTVLGALDGPGLTLDRWIRSSWLYRWLTAEPEPDVIVIDLRETYTVGPVLAALDRAVERAAPRWRDSAPDRALAWASTTVTNAPVRVASWIAILAFVGSLLTSIVSGRSHLEHSSSCWVSRCSGRASGGRQPNSAGHGPGARSRRSWYRPIYQRSGRRRTTIGGGTESHSTVTLFARLRGLSMGRPSRSATW